MRSFSTALFTSNKFLIFYLILMVFCLLIRDVGCCPDGCACLGVEQVICNQAGLPSIPSNLPETTKYLSLGENSIVVVPTGAFEGLRNLKSVRLDSNNITNISKYAFRGLSDMDEITLQKNPLDHLPSYSFAELRNVARLYLSYNKIATIHANAFYNSRDIREVSLVGNPLAVIQSFAFMSFSGVQYFYFPVGIQRLEKNAFSGLRNVNVLRLERLNMRELSSGSFDDLKNISGLEIRGSNIGSLSSGAFQGLSNVDYFNLEGNTIGEIRKDTFRGLRHVGVAMILKNTIEDLQDGGFSGLAEAVKSKRVNFTDNRIPCDCRLGRFVVELSELAPEFRDVNDCQLPEDIIGERAAIVDLAQLDDCPTVAPLLDDVYLQEKTLDLDVSEMDVDVNKNGGDVLGSTILWVVVPLIWKIYY